MPAHRFGGAYSALVPLAGWTLVQVTTGIDADGPVAAAQLAPGGGPGSFTHFPAIGTSPMGMPVGQRTTVAGCSRYPMFGRIRLPPAPSIPSMSRAGLAAAAALLLLAVAYALRRRYP